LQIGKKEGKRQNAFGNRRKKRGRSDREIISLSERLKSNLPAKTGSDGGRASTRKRATWPPIKPKKAREGDSKEPEIGEVGSNQGNFRLQGGGLGRVLKKRRKSSDEQEKRPQA